MSGQVDETVGTPTEQPKRSSGGSRFVGIVGIIIGALMVIGGIAAWIGRSSSPENITVAEDAAFLQGAPVADPLTAWAQAEVIQKHALELTGGKTYAELDQDDPLRRPRRPPLPAHVAVHVDRRLRRGCSRRARASSRSSTGGRCSRSGGAGLRGRAMQSSGGASVALETVDAWWRAANYLSVGQIYLMRNPLLDRPLEPDDIKPRLLGHWGTSPGLNLVYAHLNRAIVERGTPTHLRLRPGSRRPGDGRQHLARRHVLRAVPRRITDDREGLERLFRQFSFPGGIPSHAAPETPGSINEGGELGYSLMHAYGAALDNPGLVVACVVGDGEAETGPLATSWHWNTFLNPVTDGAVLPILHLNGYKIANPTLLARIPEAELVDFFRGNGYEPPLVLRSRARTRWRCTVAARRRSTSAYERDRRDPGGCRGGRVDEPRRAGR